MSLFEDILQDKPITESLNNNELFLESVYPSDIPYLKTMTRKILLPKGTNGKGSLCFLYTNNTNESIDVINNKNNFFHNNKYFYYFYNPIYKGKLYNKVYRINDTPFRKKLYKKIQKETRVKPYIKLTIDPKESKNMYFDLSKYIEIFNSICENLVPKKRVNLYWNYLKAIINMSNFSGYQNKFILIDIDKFKLNKSLAENLSNPVFMIYYSMLKYPDLIKDINIDFYLFTDKKCLKVNLSQVEKKTYAKFKIEMTRLYSSANIEEITNEDTIKNEEAIEKTVSTINENINKSNDSSVITNETLKKTPGTKVTSAFSNADIYNKIREKANVVKRQVEEVLPNTKEIPDEAIADTILSKVEDDIDSDKELINEIYDKTIAPIIPKSSASTARDKELKKNQENIKIGNMTIKELQKIQTNHIPIPVTDVSSNVRTTNKNISKLSFNNFEKTYNEKLMTKDITDAILSLNNKEIPMYVRDIKVEDTSDELNYKDTYTILLEDSNRKRHTIKVDIPKFIEDKFLYIGGNKKLIKKQNLLYPVVKTSADEVQITTNYNKMFIQRIGTKSISSIERLKSTIKKMNDFESHFTFGNSSSANTNFITTIEYDELSRIITKYKNNKIQIFFNQNEAFKYAVDNGIEIPKHYLFIGINNSKPIFINTDTQKTDDEKTIVDLILESSSPEVQKVYSSIKSPKKLMYTRVVVMKKPVSVGLLIGFWEGLNSILTKSKAKYRLEDKLPALKPNENFLRFADCYLVYDANITVDLLLNGFRLIDTSQFYISEMDTREPYMGYIIKVYGRAAIGNALLNFYDFTMDPITVEVCKDLNIPTDLVELIIYAVSLLSDSQFTPEINQGLSRVRSNEIIPAILYDCLAKKYVHYRNSNGRKKYSVPQDCVIKELLAVKTVEDYSTLNPILELEMVNGISSKGFRGANLDDAYTMSKRTYDPTCVGIISPSTSPDGSVGVNKTLTMNPSITSLRGYVDLKDQKLDELNDSNLFSPGELSIPLAATRDDPTRLGHALKQSKHVIPVKNSSPVLMSNGFEEVCRFELSSDFVVNAKENGTVVDYDESSQIMIVKYKSGKCQAINLGETIVKNGGGGFFLSNKLITSLKVGDTFKKDDVLAYHKDFFTNDKFNNCRMNMGTLAKVAIMSTYNTYQDATMITEKLSDEAATEMCFVRQVTIGKNANVEFIVKKGDEIKVGDSLIQFDTSYEDNSLNTLLANLSESEQESVLEGSRNDIHSKYSGVIEEIKIYSTVNLDELSPSLRKIVGSYYRKIDKKKKFLEKYDPDSKTSIVKCGLLLNETTKKIEPNKFGVIKGQKIEEGGVMIEFYIKHSEPLEIGSKIANFTALKNTIGEIIPKGYEPWSSFRPDEEVSTIIASNSILKRMTPSILLTALGNKCIVELKNRLKEIYNEKD